MPRHRLADLVPLALSLLVLLSAAAPAAAQDTEIFDLFKPQLKVGLEASGEKEIDAVDPDSSMVSGSDTFRWAGADLGFNLPLGGTHLHPGGRLAGHQIFAHAFSSASRARLSFLPEPDLDIYSGGIGFSALMLTPGKKLAAVAVFATVAEEEDTLDDPDVRTTGLALGSFTTGSAFWIYGGGFTYHLGRPVPFPIFGGWGRVSPSWSLGGVVPFLFRARYQPDQRWSLDLFMKLQGNQYGYDNSPGSGARDFPGRGRDLRLRIFQGRLGASFSWNFSGSASLVTEAGSLVARRVVFSEDGDPFLRADIKPAGYARLLLRLSFGETLLDPERP